jgi:hypothetical protein
VCHKYEEYEEPAKLFCCEISHLHETLFSFFFSGLEMPFSSLHSKEEKMGVAIFRHSVLGGRQNTAGI